MKVLLSFAMLTWSSVMLTVFLWDVGSWLDHRVSTACWGFSIGIWFWLTLAALVARRGPRVRITIREVGESEIPPELRESFLGDDFPRSNNRVRDHFE